MQLRTIDDYAQVSESLKARFTSDELKFSGLFNEKGHLRFYKHRLLIPYLIDGEARYFQARAMDPETRPKELNPSGPVPFPYNIHAVSGSAIVYLCEGAIDTLTLIENGFPAAGAPGAMSFKPEWLSFFRGKRVFSVLDNDKAGRAGNRRLKAIFAKAGIPFSVIDIPEGRDINDIFRR
jgi:DNA primase